MSRVDVLATNAKKIDLIHISKLCGGSYGRRGFYFIPLRHLNQVLASVWSRFQLRQIEHNRIAALGRLSFNHTTWVLMVRYIKTVPLDGVQKTNLVSQMSNKFQQRPKGFGERPLKEITQEHFLRMRHLAVFTISIYQRQRVQKLMVVSIKVTTGSTNKML